MRLIFIALATLILASCDNAITGSGNIVEIGRDVPNFQDLSTMGSIDVEVQPGDTYSLKIVGDDNIVPHVITEVKNGELQVHYEKNMSFRKTKAKVVVTVPFLNQIKTTGSGDVTSNGQIMNNQMITISSRGSGDVNVSLNAPAVKVIGAGSGDFKLSGETKDAEYTLSGSGDVSAKNLMAENVKVKIAGSGSVQVHASATLRASISGSGNIRYWGNPSLEDINVAGSGKIRAGD